MQSQSQQQYEGTMLIQLIKNYERLAVVEVDVAQILKKSWVCKILRSYPK